MKLNVIHIFGYGEAQIISDTINHKANVSEFKKLQAVIDDIKALKPKDVEAAEYHAINIFGSTKADYVSKGEKNKGNFSVKFENLNATKLSALVTEFETLKATYDAAEKAKAAAKA